MNRTILKSTSLLVFALAGLTTAHRAQTNEPRPEVPAARIEDCGKEIRRVPKADVYKDEAGETIYVIKGNESWRRTEVEVRRGQKIEISANGIVRWAPDGIEKIDVTPDGTRPPYRDGWNYNHFPYPATGIGSLVMRIGKGIYPAGSNLVVDLEDDGFVEFMVNDDKLDDNSGYFLVRVRLQ